MSKLIYKDLSYVVNGILFETHNQIGFGYREKVYCQAIIELLKEKDINFIYQYKIPLFFYNKEIGKRYMDFLIDDKIVVEIKVRNKIRTREFNQLKEYLRFSGYKLGLLVVFEEEGVKIYRVLNIY